MIKNAKNEAILEPKETKEIEDPQPLKCGCTCHPYQLPPFFSNCSKIICVHCSGREV